MCRLPRAIRRMRSFQDVNWSHFRWSTTSFLRWVAFQARASPTTQTSPSPSPAAGAQRSSPAPRPSRAPRCRRSAHNSLLRRLPVVGRVLFDRDVARHPPQHGVPRVTQLVAEKQLFELFGRRRHAGESLTERDDLEPVPIKLGRQLGGVPAIDGDLTNAITAFPPIGPRSDAGTAHRSHGTARPPAGRKCNLARPPARRPRCEYVTYHHACRPHQGISNRLIGHDEDDWPPPVVSLAEAKCETRLGGLLKHYYRAA